MNNNNFCDNQCDKCLGFNMCIKPFKKDTKREIMYKEILELEKYCEKIGVVVKKEKMYDGYVLRFKNGGDVIQHRGSYSNNWGCVEFGFTGFKKTDFTAITLKKAKSFVKRNKEKLNTIKKKRFTLS